MSFLRLMTLSIVSLVTLNAKAKLNPPVTPIDYQSPQKIPQALREACVENTKPQIELTVRKELLVMGVSSPFRDDFCNFKSTQGVAKIAAGRIFHFELSKYDPVHQAYTLSDPTSPVTLVCEFGKSWIGCLSLNKLAAETSDAQQFALRAYIRVLVGSALPGADEYPAESGGHTTIQ